MLIKLPKKLRRDIAKSGNLLQLYRNLGWDASFTLDPSQLELNPTYAGKMLNSYMRKLSANERASYMDLYIKYGPSNNSNLKPRQMNIHSKELARMIRARHPEWIIEL